ncbi:MAG: ArsC/Spx/MgsR family protein [Bacteroidales bacterium]
MSYKIYHNTRCKKSRAGLKHLEDKGIKPQIIQYLKDQPFTEKSLKEVLKKLSLKPYEIIRTQEADYKQKYKGKDFSDDEWVKILINNPKLIRRPIIVKDNKAVLGDIIEHIDTLI